MESTSKTGSEPVRAETSCLRPLCRNFARGSCRRGESCRFSHDRKSTPVCRYFQRGFCRYGERCSYQHIQEEPAPAEPQNGLVPHHHQDEESDTESTAMDGDQEGAQGPSVHPASSMTCVTLEFHKLEIEVEDKDKENIPEPDNLPCGAIGGEFVPTEAQDDSDFQPQEPAPDPASSGPRKAVSEVGTHTDPEEDPAELGAAAALATSSSSASLRAQSEDVVCGICWEKVYENPRPQQRRFGILPNCSHAFCLGCIRKWRRSRGFQSRVVNACPVCRVVSSYYIPHQYWITDVGEKEELIRTFKEQKGKIRCKFFDRGHCHFRSECIFLHELPAHGLQRRRRRRRRIVRMAELNFSSSESSDEEDDWAHNMAEVEAEFPSPPSCRGVLEILSNLLKSK